jgi:hypothetical protein
MNKAVENIIRQGELLSIGNQLFRDYGVKPAACYSLRRIFDDAYRAIRVRRSSDSSETDVGFCGENLCAGSLLSFTNYSDLSKFPNPSMSVDDNSDGINDGWSTISLGTATRTYSIVNGYQRISQLTTVAGTTYSRVVYFNSSTTKASEGDIVTISLTAKKISTVGTANAVIVVTARTAGGAFINQTAATITETSDTVITVSHTMPATTAYYQVYLQVAGNGLNDEGTFDFKNLSVVNVKASAYVTTWYDQSGNGNNATQSTAGNQPRIVNAGVIHVDDYGRPTVVGISANSTQLVTGSVFSYTQLHAFAVGKFSADQTALFQFGSANTNGNLFTFNSNVVSAETALSPETVASTTVATCKTKSNIYSTTYQTDLRQIYANGVKGTDGTNSSALNVSNSALTLLSRNGAYYNEGFNSEFIFFTTILTDAQRQKIERNMSRYYGIGVA